MTKRLSDAFFGDKKLTQVSIHSKLKSIYRDLTSNSDTKLHKFTQAQIHSIFSPYTSKIQSIQSEVSPQVSLLTIFSEFMCLVSQKFQHWQFQKYSSVMEIAAHVFEHSFESWLTKDESFKYFSEVMVRHSLFRPPHSVAIFTYEEMRQVTEFWIEHFLRFFEEFEECFKSQLEETINAVNFPQNIDKQAPLSSGKLVNKDAVLKFL